MPRDQLDLRGKSMSELMELDATLGNELGNWEWEECPCADCQELNNLLADRRQIRAEMERRRVAILTTVDGDDILVDLTTLREC